MFQLHSNAVIQEDAIVSEILKNKSLKKPHVNQGYNYQSVKKIPVKASIIKSVSTRNEGVYDGMPLVFKVQNNIEYKNKILIKKGAHLNARTVSYTSKGMNGVPACIYVTDFNIEGINPDKLTQEYRKCGFNMTAYILPLKWALTFLPPLGTFTNFIPGANASIKPSDIVTLYYYPEWHENIKEL